MNLNKNKALLTIFLTILTDLIGFGMIIPLSPLLARDFGADGLEVGLLISSYSFVQFLFAPFWGRLSDSFGRKPVLLFGLLGMSLAHVSFAFSTTLTGLFLSRAIAGFFGGNIVISTAYISDVTDSQNRTKNLGLIGVAFGLGFTIGPLLGGLLLFLGDSLGSAPPFGLSFASLAAGGLSALNFLMAFIFLKESHPLKVSGEKSLVKQNISSFSRPSFLFILKSLKQPVLGKVFFISFILWFALAQIEPTLILLVRDEFFWSQKSAYWGFAYIGLLMAFSQGVLVRKLISSLGEKIVNSVGLLLFSFGVVFIGLSLFGHQSVLTFLNQKITLSLLILTLAVTLFSIGHSLASTSLSGALSLLSSEKEQGQVFGINQSLSALARIVGPVFGGWMYRDFSHMSPFLIAGGFSFGAFFLAIKMKDSFPNSGKLKGSSGKLKGSSVKIKETEESSLYSLDKMQFVNLIQKRIGFHLIPLEPFPSEPSEHFLVRDNKGKTSLFLSALFKELKLPSFTLHNITLMENVSKDFNFLKSLPKDQAFIFICEKGEASESFSQKVREQGYHNAYYVEKGWKTLSS